MSSICLYASKPCANPRSTKENGQLHRLCDLHRARANAAQRRWHKRQRDGEDTLASTPVSPTKKVKAEPDQHSPIKAEPVTEQEEANESSVAMAFPLDQDLAIEPLTDEDFALLSELMVAIDAPPLAHVYSQKSLEELFMLRRWTTTSTSLRPSKARTVSQFEPF